MENISKIENVTGRAIPLEGNDIDTDRIIPARFLRCVTFDGLGEQVFRDERFENNEPVSDHPFNDPAFAGGSVLIVNANFGCGSSREHAPQALMRFGVKAIIGESFAEIFAGNCTNLGIPLFTADEATVQKLQQLARTQPELEFSLDLDKRELTVDGKTLRLAMDDSSRTALMNGGWDSLAELLQNLAQVETRYSALPYTSNYR